MDVVGEEKVWMDYLIKVQHAHVPRGLGTKGEILLRSVPFLGL